MFNLTDSAYTERYMGLPSEESENYIRADAITRSQYFKNKKYLIVHGSADGMI